jgi:hypothetical protein
MFLQLSSSSADFMNKGNVFIFWRLDEKEMFLQLSLSSGDLIIKGMLLQLSLSSGDLIIKGMLLQLSLSSVDLMNKGNVFTTVFIFCRLDEQRKCFYNCL